MSFLAADRRKGLSSEITGSVAGRSALVVDDNATNRRACGACWSAGT